jgi:hypothetical protein
VVRLNLLKWSRSLHSDSDRDRPFTPFQPGVEDFIFRSHSSRHYTLRIFINQFGSTWIDYVCLACILPLFSRLTCRLATTLTCLAMSALRASLFWCSCILRNHILVAASTPVGDPLITRKAPFYLLLLFNHQELSTFACTTPSKWYACPPRNKLHLILCYYSLTTFKMYF